MSFFGRTEHKNVERASAHIEYMEEDFLFINDDEDELLTDLHYHPLSQKIEIPNYNNISANKSMVSLGKLQMLQDELKSCAFESTEAMIYNNR